MKSNHKILCPVDFSDCSLNAIEFATRIGELYQSQLTLVHVVNSQDYFKLFPGETDSKKQEQFIKTKLENLKTAVAEESIPKGLATCDTLIIQGKIVDTVCGIAEDGNYDLIVIGTDGVNGNRSGKMGSRSSQIVANSEKDVLVIPRASYFKKMDKIAYAQDYLEEDKIAIQKVGDVANFFKSTLDVVHFERKLNERNRFLNSEIQEELKPFSRNIKLNFKLFPIEDSLVESIQDYCENEKVGILFTLSFPQSIWDRLFDRSLSKKLAFSLSTPLWVIKSF